MKLERAAARWGGSTSTRTSCTSGRFRRAASSRGSRAARRAAELPEVDHRHAWAARKLLGLPRGGDRHERDQDNL